MTLLMGQSGKHPEAAAVGGPSAPDPPSRVSTTPVTADGHTGERACLNCGTELIGEHCHACGQKAHVHRTLRGFLHDLVHGVLHYEGKAWRTLPLLALRPGELTRRYIDGERARFLSPVALFLFSVFLMFAVFAFGPSAGSIEVRNTRADVTVALRHARTDLALLERSQVGKSDRETSKVASVVAADGRLVSPAEQIAAARRAVALLAAAEEAVISARGYGPRAKLPRLKRLEIGLNKLYENPALAFYKLQNSAYKYSWLLIPLLAPLLWLLFPLSKQFRLYDHTLFVTFMLCFITLLAVLLSLLMWIGLPSTAAAAAAAILLPTHMYRQLRGAYGLGRAAALWRALLLMLFAAVVTVAFAFLLLLIGALG